MKHLGISMVVALAAAAFALSVPADAKRLGGGGSFGAQRPSVTPKAPASAPNAASQPVMPATPGATLPAKPAMPAAAAPAAASGMSKWMGPIAGIAAGLGLAALLSHFGLPEGMGSFLLLALLGIAVVFIVRAFLARRTATPTRSPLQYAGAAGANGAAKPAAYEPPPAPAWGGAQRIEPVMGAATEPVAAARSIPAGFDVAGFTKQARSQFIRMQAAYDAGDRATLSELMTPEMYAEVAREIDTRVAHTPTEVVTLVADLVEVTTEGGSHWASVRYSGMLKEDGEAVPKPIDEAWNLTKPVDGSTGWLLAGIQQYA